MDYLSHNVAVNLKRIRRSRGMSLDLVAEQTGVSKSMLAQIEKDRANPSLGVLGKISSGLRVKVEELLGTRRPLAAAGSGSQIWFPQKRWREGIRSGPVSPMRIIRALEIYRIEIEPGHTYESGGHGEKTMEYISVSEGELVIQCADERHCLTKEDILRFETDQMHSYINEGTGKSEFSLCVRGSALSVCNIMHRINSEQHFEIFGKSYKK